MKKMNFTKNFNRLIALMTSFVLFGVVAYAQCPVGQTQIDVTYTAGGFNAENGWALYDATAGTILACQSSGGAGPAAGTTTLCAIDGNSLELHTFESFGDGWCAPANIAIETNEDGSVNGCGVQNISIVDGDGGASGNGTFTCPAGPFPVAAPSPGGFIFGGPFVVACLTCEITCPADVTVDNDLGICGAFVNLPLATITADCAGVGGGMFSADWENGCTGNVPAGNSTKLTIPASPPPANLADPVTVKFLINADINSCAFEHFALSNDGTAAGDLEALLGPPTLTGAAPLNCGPAGGFPNTYGSTSFTDQCGPICIEWTMPYSQYQAVFAGGVSGGAGCGFVTAVGTGISCTLCAGDDLTMIASWALPPLILNDFNATIDGNASGTYPVGCNTVTFTTFTATGDPVECQTKVTVNDAEAPVIACPADLVFNLLPGECEIIVTWDVTSNDNCDGLQSLNASTNAGPTTIAGPFCDPCADPSGGSALACPTGPTHIIQLISGVNAGDTLTDICFNQETFGGAVTITVNVYAYAGGPIPFDDGAGTFVPFATTTYATQFGDNGQCVCVAMPANTIVPGGTTQMAVEIISPLNVRAVQTPPNCDGNAGTGLNSWIVAPVCGNATPGSFASIGFGNLDASYAAIVLPFAPITVDDTFVGCNEFVTGDAIPTGTHCFAYKATDTGGGMDFCQFNITVNEFPGATTTLAANDNVQVSLNPDGGCTPVTADMVLEGGPYGCYDNFYMARTPAYQGPACATTATLLSDCNGAPLGGQFGFVPVDCNDLGKTITVTIVDTATCSMAWATLTIEDKVAPVIECPDYDVDCTESTDPVTVVPPPVVGGTVSAAADAPGLVWNAFTPQCVQTDFPIEVAENCTDITNIQLAFDIQSTDLDDFAWDLISPSGTSVRFLPGPAFGTPTCNLGGNRNLTTIFDDTGAAVGCPAQPLTAPLPGPFANFNGESSAGTWIVRVVPIFCSDPLTVLNLELFITGTCGAAATVVWSDNSDACQQATLDFVDDLTGGSCATGTSGSIVRTWTATDIAGNTTKCTQNITINRPSLDDVEFPSDIITLDCSSPYPDTFAAVCVKDTTDFGVMDLGLSIDPITGDTNFYNGGPLADGETLLAFDIDNNAAANRTLKDINVNIALTHGNIFETKLWLARLDANGNVISRLKLYDPNPNLNYIKCSVNTKNSLDLTFDDESCPMAHEACVSYVPSLAGQYQPFNSINGAYAGLPVNAHSGWDWALIYSDTLAPLVSTNLGTLTDFSIEYLYSDNNIVTTPTVSGGPFRSGDICGLTASYTDEVIDVCPTSYKIIRSWTVIDWCGTDPATRTARFEQLIKVIDTCPPVIENKRTRLNDNNTLDIPVYTPSTAAGAHTVCMGNATVPPISICYENCSGVASYSTKLYTADGSTLLGSVPTNGGTFTDLTLDLADMHDDGSPDDKNAADLVFPILDTPNPFDSISIPGISYLNEPDAIYLVTYEVTDACGNTSSLDCFIRLLDKIPPVPVCREETQVALTGFNGDTTTLCADDLDEGSYDNCGNVCFFIRKMVDEDDVDPIGAPDFGTGPQHDLVFEIMGRDGAPVFDLARDFVYKNCTSFTCDDIGEDNQVFLLVVDDFVVNFVNDYLDNLFPFIDVVVDYNQVPLTILPYDKNDDNMDGNIADIATTSIDDLTDNDRYNRGKRYFEFYLNDDPRGGDPLFIIPTAQVWEGHFNFCMVNVHVEDKVRPTCEAPEDVWANCTDLPDNIDFTDTDQLTTLFGSAIADDNCSATIEELNPNVQVDLCGVGQIIRRFRAEDAYGNRSLGNCSQTIMIMPVNSYKLNVPGDYEEECVNSGPQDFLYEEYACDLIAINSEDVELLASTDGECKKIIRTWSLINWCEYDGSSVATILPRLDLNNDGIPGDGNGGSNSPVRHNAMHMWVSNGDIMILNDNPNVTLPSTGRYTYEQHIKIFDNTAPEVEYDGDVKFCGGDLDEDPCTAEVDITPTVTDFCTNTSGRWELDAFSTRFFDADFSGNGGSLTGRWPLGVHTVRFYFEDECGNISQFDVTFEAVDCKAPTPVCHNGLSIDVMPLSGMVELWAVDFDASSFDYCSPFDFRINRIEDRNGDGVITNDDYQTTLPSTDSIQLTCADVNAGITMVQLWVAEQDGTSDDGCPDNQDNDYCVTFVEVQDNNGVCGGPKVALGGKVTNEENESVENVTIDLNIQGMNTITTANDGEYLFPSLPQGGDYSVTPMRNDDVDNGVSTYDLVLISKHVLNVDLLDSPYKVVAADANKSGNISTLDLVAIRKVILRVENQFPNNTSWRFVDKAYAFSTIPGAAGESFPEVVSYNNLATDELAADFIAVKIGDVSGDAIPNSILGVDDRTFNGTLNLNAEKATAVAGEEFTVEFTADKNVLGYQFTLDYNEKAVELVDIVDGLAKEAINFNVVDGKIATSWNDEAATADQAMFSLVFRAKSDVDVMDIMSVTSELTKAEAYSTDGDLMGIALNFGGTTATNDFALYQNTPNPFESETMIGFTLPEASSATITISDVAGKIVKVVKGDFAKGYNTVNLTRSDIGVATGVLSYKLETPTHSATKQMIIIK